MIIDQLIHKEVGTSTNHHVVDNGYIEVYPSDYPILSTSDSVPYTDITPIKKIDDDEMDQLLKYSTQSMMIIFWMLTSICFRLD